MLADHYKWTVYTHGRPGYLDWEHVSSCRFASSASVLRIPSVARPGRCARFPRVRPELSSSFTLRITSRLYPSTQPLSKCAAMVSRATSSGEAPSGTSAESRFHLVGISLALSEETTFVFTRNGAFEGSETSERRTRTFGEAAVRDEAQVDHPNRGRDQKRDLQPQSRGER